MEVSEAVKNRHSVRVFKDEAVPLNTITEIIDKARQTPSWVDSQPWKVYLATGATLKKIRQVHLANSQNGEADSDWPTWHREEWAPYPRRHMALHTENRAAFIGEQAADAWAEMQHELYHAPAILYLTIPKESPNWSMFDLGAFAQTIMLLAQEAGLDSMEAYEFVRFPDSIRKIMDIGEDEAVAIGIGLGKAAEHKFNDYQAVREDLDQILKIKE